MITFPDTRDLVLIGGGHTHALVLRKWGMNPLPGVRLTLINPTPTAAYSGMLPGFLAGHYGKDDLGIDLVQLARFAGARLILGSATHIDRDARKIHVTDRPDIAYDACSIDIGITSMMPNLPGFEDHAAPAKPLAPFAKRWDAFRGAHDTADIAVIGGGVAGVEVAMAMHHAMPKATVRVIDRGRALEHVGRRGRQRLLYALQDRGVQLIENADVVSVQAQTVTLGDGSTVASDFTVGAAGALPFAWTSEIGVKMSMGSIVVGPTLQSSDEQIFAVGDCAHMSQSPRPKAGVFAVRQAPVLLDNLRAVLSGGALRSFRPQSDYLKLISLGGKEALAAKHGIVLSGRRLWQLKDHIDQKFMRQFQNLPVMGVPSLPEPHALGLSDSIGTKPMCAGCGSKVSKTALWSSLANGSGSHDGDDAAVLETGGQRQVFTTDHLRGFTLDPVVMTRIAATHALGDVWAMGATPQAAVANLIIPRVSDALQERTLSEIMEAARGVFSAAGAPIVGGHTSMGAELTIGFTITGLLEQDPIRVSGAIPGLALILTKPIGTGVILAAEMATQAQGVDVAATYEAMSQGQADASKILVEAGALAMTDVTGFGLLGHLWGMCEASQCAAEIDQTVVPHLPGARALFDAGFRSSLFTSNVAAVGQVIGAADDLLFDPQTAGGLLAAVPLTAADAACAALHSAGYDEAVIIGRTVAGSPAISVIS